MNDNSGDRRGPRGRLRPRRAGLLAATAGIALLAAACSGTSTAGADTFLGGTYSQSLAFAKCMRSHGVPQFPAPDGQGNFNNSQIESITQNKPQARNAWAKCGSLLPNEGSGLSATQLQDMQQQNLRNAESKTSPTPRGQRKGPASTGSRCSRPSRAAASTRTRRPTRPRTTPARESG
jgi:hypothetical protein